MSGADMGEEEVSRFWVTRPGQPIPQEARDETDRVKRELDRLEALGDDSACRLCAERRKLTREHAPSKAAGNRGRMIEGTVDTDASAVSGLLSWKGKTTEGAVFRSLCGVCNNLTGSWYNPAYVAFTRWCTRLVRPELAGQRLEFDVALYRQRIAKQALTSIVATSQPGLTTAYPSLRQVIRSKDGGKLDSPLRLWLYLRANRDPLGMVTGVCAMMNHDRKRGQLVAGFCFGPLGWILTLGDVPLEESVDVSLWTEFDYHDKRLTRISVPCRWALTTYPGDFRTPE